jgi:hypothetical protein
MLELSLVSRVGMGAPVRVKPVCLLEALASRGQEVPAIPPELLQPHQHVSLLHLGDPTGAQPLEKKHKIISCEGLMVVGVNVLKMKERLLLLINVA